MLEVLFLGCIRGGFEANLLVGLGRAGMWCGMATSAIPLAAIMTWIYFQPDCISHVRYVRAELLTRKAKWAMCQRCNVGYCQRTMMRMRAG